MNFYKRHLGDIAKACGHLSQGQMGAYDLLLDWLYGNEKPLPLAPEKLYRIARATSKQEKENTMAVLAEFFLASDAGYTQKRASEEIDRASHIREVNREVGKLGGRPKKEPNENRIETESVPKNNPSQTPDSRKSKEEQPSVVCPPDGEPPDPCPHQEIVALYHATLPANPPIKAWGGSRAANLRTRWREDAKRQSLDYWRRFFDHVAASEFLTGRKADRNGRPFLPGLDWLVLPNNFAKVIEGRYHDAR